MMSLIDAVASLIGVFCLRCVWKHSRFAKIPQQTKYAHGRHDISSCGGHRAIALVQGGQTAEAPKQQRMRVNVHVSSTLSALAEV